jgi:DNA/RNA endonuclease YhcR with UshA esterase domain
VADKSQRTTAHAFRYGSLLLALLALAILLWVVTHSRSAPNSPEQTVDQTSVPDMAVAVASVQAGGGRDLDTMDQVTPVGDTPGNASPTLFPEATAQPTFTPSPESIASPSLSLTLPPTATSTVAPTPLPTPLPEPTSFMETRAIGTISNDDLGASFTIVRAEIAGVTYFSRGIKYSLSDGTGSIILLIWQNVVEELQDRYSLVPGTWLQVTGEIDEYQGELEIVPRNGHDVVVVAPAMRQPVEDRTVDSITASDEGRIFAVDGVVTRIESSGWLKVWLDDGTGEILVFIPSRVVEFLPPGIALDMRLRVTGEVDVYGGVLEIIPSAGEDVEVL